MRDWSNTLLTRKNGTLCETVRTLRNCGFYGRSAQEGRDMRRKYIERHNYRAKRTVDDMVTLMGLPCLPIGMTVLIGTINGMGAANVFYGLGAMALIGLTVKEYHYPQLFYSRDRDPQLLFEGLETGQ